MTPTLSNITEDDALAWQRREFPTLHEVLHLANCSHAPESLRVRRAMEEYAEEWRHRGMDWDYWMDEVDDAKAMFARLIGASPDEIAIASSASQAAATVVSAFDWTGLRSTLIATDAEFPTVGQVWVAFGRYGVNAEFIPVHDGRIEVEEYERRVDEKTQLVSATHIYYHNGFKQDIRAIADITHRAGGLLLVDAYQSLGAGPVDVRELDVDILIGGCLKYLLGVPGVAFVYARRAIHERLRPAVTGWFGRVDPMAFDPQTVDYASTAKRLEMGTPPVLPAIAAKAGMSIIEDANPSAIGERLRRLSEYGIARAADLGLEYAGPANLDEKGGAIALRVPEPESVEHRLKERRVIVSARRDVIRIAPHFFTTTDDLDRGLTALREVI